MSLPPIQFKRSNVTGRVPLPRDLAEGEITLNFPDRKIFSKSPEGDIVEFGGGTVEDPLEVDNLHVSGRVRNGIFSLTGTTPSLNPSNGVIQTWTLTGNSTPTYGDMSDGDHIVLMIDDGSDYSITWSSVVWRHVAPVLKTTGYTIVVLHKVGGTVYGSW